MASFETRYTHEKYHGVKTGPIIACVSDDQYLIEEQIDKRIFKTEKSWLKWLAGRLFRKTKLEHVDYFGSDSNKEQNNQIHAGERTYTLSSVGPEDKVSHRYLNCTGIAMVGVSKTPPHKNISLLTHQDPHFFLSNSTTQDQFINDLSVSMQHFISQVDIETVSTIIFGGNYFNRRNLREITHKDDYIDSVDVLRKAINSVDGLQNIEPEIISGPNMIIGGSTAVLFDTKNRRLFMVRPIQHIKQNQEGNFPASCLNGNAIKWDKERIDKGDDA